MAPGLSSFLRGVGNQFNTAAAGGRGPLSAREIRSRLVADLFFANEVYLPATSLLCNPSTPSFLREDNSLLLGLMQERRVTPVFPSETPTFRTLAERLIDTGSAAIAITGLDHASVRSLAGELDGTLDEGAQPHVNAVDLDEAKTAASRRMILGLRDVIPISEEQHGNVMALASREFDERGTISGSWWYYLAKETLPELRFFDQTFSEFGNILFDFSYAQVLESPLVGHSYDQDIRGLDSLTRPFVPTVGIDTCADAFDVNDMDPCVFDWQILGNLRVQDVLLILEATTDARTRWLTAFARLQAEKTESGLLEAKERLDEYLAALARHIRSQSLERFTLRARELKRLTSRILVLQTSNVAIYAFAVAGGWNEVVRQSLSQETYGLVVMAGLGTVGAHVATRLRRRKDELESQVIREHENLARLRPANVYVTPAQT